MNQESTTSAQGTAPEDRAFFGHPRGLATLFFTEFWERFSYYGMRALLVLYMTTPTTLGGLGFDTAEAGALYGIYTALVYLTAVPGGILADRFIGHRRAVLYGGIIIALGHVCLALKGMSFFYSGLGLVIIGTGLLKPNISTMVGSLYGQGDNRRDGGFSIFYMGINLGGGLAPLACGYLAQDKGFQEWLLASGFDPLSSWHWGFGAAAVGMFAGILQFLYGTRFLGTVGAEPVPVTDAVAHLRLRNQLVGGTVGLGLILGTALLLNQLGVMDLTLGRVNLVVGAVLLISPIAYFAITLTRPEWSDVERKRISVVAILFIYSVLFWSSFEQAGSSFNLFADRLTRTEIFGYQFPSSWFQSVNSAFIILLAPVFGALWVALKEREPSSPGKFAYGLGLISAGFVVVATAALLSGPEQEKVSPLWLVLVYLLHTMGELCLSPVGLSMVTKLAPPRAVGQLMGVWFMSISVGNYVGGQIASLFEKFPLPQLFGAVAVTIGVASLSLALFVKNIRKLMGGVH